MAKPLSLVRDFMIYKLYFDGNGSISVANHISTCVAFLLWHFFDSV